MNDLYAKPDQRYEEHIRETYRAWQETVAAKKRLIERMAELYGFSVERFEKSSLLTIVLHDLGKVIEPFQDMMRAIREGKKYNSKDNYRHELISFAFVAYAVNILNRDNLLTYMPVEALSVAGHHRPLNIDLTSFERESTSSKPRFYQDGLKYALDLASEIMALHGWKLKHMDERLQNYNPYNTLASLVDPMKNIIGKLLERDGYEKARNVYVLMKGILHYSDWHASGKAKVNYSIDKSPDLLIENLAGHCRGKGIHFKGLRPFQRSMGECSGHLIAIAPTGSGKTEGSLLWALKNAKEMGGAKILYLLPTMNTANQIWKRLSDIFGKENVGLTHSTANLFLSGEVDESEGDSWEDRFKLLFDQSFIRPITVGTVDQLLSAGFNAGRWVLKEVNAANAAIIIDEVHSYDGWTLGLIISSLRHFARIGTRFLLMSATMPEMLISLFKRELSDVKEIREDALLSTKRSNYQVIDLYIEEAIEAIEEAVVSGHKVLAIVNTVEKCQYLTQCFKKLKPICYHSRFILKDRKRIEEEIEKSRFVIATQVLEVSLDIDYDWLFTECAPPDAIVQRAGRVNRYRDPKRDSRVFIYKPSPQAEKLYNPINNDPELLARSYKMFQLNQGNLCENDLLHIVQEVYQGFNIEEREEFQEALKMYFNCQEKRMAIFDSRLSEDKQEVTRRSKYDTVSVIPASFSEEILNITPWERRWYEVKVPLWFFQKNRKIYKSQALKDLNFCDIEYNKNIGALLEPKREKFNEI